MFCVAADFWRRLSRPPEEREENPNKPNVATDREIATIRLIGKAVRIETQHRFLFVIWGLCNHGCLHNGPTLEEVERQRAQQSLEFERSRESA